MLEAFDTRDGQRDAGPSPGGRDFRLSQEMEEIVLLASGRTIRVRVLVERLAARGHVVLAFFLVIPFLQPIPLPGVSTPFGAAVALVGLLMALGRPPFLPARWLERELPSPMVVRVVRAAQRLLRLGERFIRPRGTWLHRHPWATPVSGMVIAISGAQLALPLPIAFTNTMPALVIATTAVGTLEQDAVLIVVGQILCVAVTSVFTGIALLPVLGLHLIF